MRICRWRLASVQVGGSKHGHGSHAGSVVCDVRSSGVSGARRRLFASGRVPIGFADECARGSSGWGSNSNVDLPRPAKTSRFSSRMRNLCRRIQRRRLRCLGRRVFRVHCGAERSSLSRTATRRTTCARQCNGRTCREARSCTVSSTQSIGSMIQTSV